MDVDLDTWKAVGIIAGAIVGLAAATAVIWKGCRSVRHFGQRAAKAVYDIVGREGNEELGIAPVLGMTAQFKETNAHLERQDAHAVATDERLERIEKAQEHGNWHMGNGGPIPMHQRLDAATEAASKACAEVAALKDVLERRLADHGCQAREVKGSRRRSTDPR